MKVRRQSYGNKLATSMIGAIIGIIMFLGSFVVLYYNEGRENLGKIAATAKEVTNNSQAKSEELICFKGIIDTSDYAEDTYLVNDEYVYIERRVEMYAYVETKHTDKKDNLGGSSTITESYTYKLEWSTNPTTTPNFNGDANEKPSITNENAYNNRIETMPKSATYQSSNIQVGEYPIADSVELSGAKELGINEFKVNLATLPNAVISEKYILQSMGENPSFSSFKEGDIRISFNIIKAGGNGIVFGAFSSGTITKFITPKGKSLLRLFSGVDTKAEAVSIFEKEHKTMTWILRLIGFILMFAGLMAMSNPITEFVSVIPIFSKVSKFAFSIIALIISLILTTLTILLSMILHNFWLAIALVAVIVLLVIVVITQKRKKAANKNAKRLSPKRQ